jgi:hypothetical protein
MIARIILAAIGAFLFLVGITPFTPLIWLLVFYHGPPIIPLKLEFWQTQTIGAVIACLGLCISCWPCVSGHQDMRILETSSWLLRHNIRQA